MEFAGGCIFVLFLFYFFKAFIATFVLYKAEKANNRSKLLNFILIWAIPFYGAYKVTKVIANNREINSVSIGNLGMIPEVVVEVVEDIDIDFDF